MIKHFCDKCGVRTIPFGAAFNIGNSHFQLPQRNSTGQIYCKYCILDAVKSLDDRETKDKEIKPFTPPDCRMMFGNHPEPPVIMPAWEDLPDHQITGGHYELRWDISKDLWLGRSNYIEIRTALQSLQKPKGASHDTKQ